MSNTKIKQYTVFILPLSVIFYISASNSITVINQAIQQFTDTTCVRWVPENTAGSYGLNHQNVVHFVNQRYVL